MSEETKKEVEELSEEDLEQVAGGGGKAVVVTQDVTIQDVTLNKSKVANKAADAIDGYIRG